MEDKTITTTNGYVVTIRPFLTYDQYIEIKRIFTSNITFNLKNTDEKGNPRPLSENIPASIMYDANKLAVSFLIVKILNPKGEEVKRDANSLPIPPIDGTEVMEEIMRISDEADAAFDKKKAKP